MHVQLLVIQRLLYVVIYLLLYYFSQILLTIGLKLCKSEIVDIQPAVLDLLLKNQCITQYLLLFLNEMHCLT